ncbi:carbohydrate binding domain-containing protein [Carboxylicivirga sp. N1Y90]|uniref:carbohydrate binding domain-containing protein n=1 Tax=Carboxylicivirga fragile TaxID=3417571 RepID=UPI003D33ECD3|nr:family 16 glycosylhydrolase [Marinilabiliaceae bacterium N1Y90]
MNLLNNNFKKIWVKCCLTLLIINSLAISISGQVNLLSNPGFETGNTEANLWGGSSLSSYNSYSGTYAAELKESDAQWGGGLEWSLTGLKNNTTYEFSAWVYTTGGTEIIGVKNYGGAEYSLSFGNSSYQLQTITFTTGPSTTTAILFIYNAPGGASVIYADDLSLTETTFEYNLIWNDEFNVDGLIDTSKWFTERGFQRNNEEQYYHSDNLIQKNGNLVISAIRKTIANEDYDPNSNDWKKNRQYGTWTSGSIATFDRFKFLYGRVECRAKVSNLLGTWPAIWTVGEPDPGAGCNEWPASGECDIMENYNGKILANYAVAGSGRWNAKWDSKAINVSDLGINNFADNYHIWTLDWHKDRMAIFVDGVLINEFNPNTQNNWDAFTCPNATPFKEIPQVLWLNLALGGNSGGSTDALPDSTVYLVDYIRVYQKNTIVSVPEPINLIDDPGFETGSSSHIWGGSSVDNIEKYAGNYSAELKDNSIWGGGYESLISNLSPNTTYTFSAWVKSSGGSEVDHGRVGVKDYGGTEIYKSFTNILFEQKSVQFTTGATNVSAKIYVYNPTGGTSILHADNLKLIASSNRLKSKMKLPREDSAFVNVQNSIVKIYPSPANNFLNIKLNLEQNETVTVSLYNTEGIEVIKRNCGRSEKNKIFQINVSNLPSGMYIVRSIIGSAVYNHSVIIN